MTNTGIDPQRLAALYPRLYHLTDDRNWPGIERHGLLSTSALLTLFGVDNETRASIGQRRRPQTVELSDPAHGTAIIRDQRPMTDHALSRCLDGQLAPHEWYRILNQRVFFWVSRQRLQRLSDAAANRKTRQLVIIVDTARLLATHERQVELSPYNTGSARKPPRSLGRGIFLSLPQYPHSAWLAKRGRQEAIVELTVLDAVADILDCMVDIGPMARPATGRPA